MTRPSETVIEISGGSGKQAWRLRYGTTMNWAGLVGPQLALGEGHRAWLSHAGWLRLIDTEKGIVIRRWHFPGEIVRLTPKGSKVELETQDRASQLQVFKRTQLFEPGAPVVPYWPNGWMQLYRTPEIEATGAWRVTGPGTKVAPEEAKKMLPELEEAVRRDPCSPWFGIILGKLLHDLGDPGTRHAFEKAVQAPTTDFTEMLSISAYLEKLGEHDAAKTAFERGYRDFWERGNDPRMVMTLLGKLYLYNPWSPEEVGKDSPQHREIIERTYELFPYCEAAWLAWQQYSDYLAKAGSPAEARVWRARAEEAKANSWSFVGRQGLFGMLFDRLLLLLFATTMAVLIYVLVLRARYQPQRRLDLAAQKPSGRSWRSFSLLYTEYWAPRERVLFFLIVFVGWYVLGLATQSVQTILRVAAIPIQMAMGSFAGPVTAWELETRLPVTPERDLLLAISYQQSGESDKAERLYRRLPQFAESWNNLGVLLKSAGKDREARQAFERARELDPQLAEAALNLGQAPRTMWTEFHQKYLLGRPMLALPNIERFGATFLGGSLTKVYVRALAGPFAGERWITFFSWVGKLAG